MELLNDHRPDSLNKVIGLTEQCAKMTSCRDSMKPVLLLGPPGSGKTLVSELLCKQANMNILDVNKDNLSHIDTFLKNNTIECFFDKRKKAIIIDNIDTLLQNDKITINYLVSLTVNKGRVFIIFTCNSNEEKKMKDLKKHVEVIRLAFPSIDESVAYISSILPRNISVDNNVIREVTSKYEGNIRESIQQLIHGTLYDKVSKFRNKSNMEIVKIALSTGIQDSEIRYLIENEPNVVSCMLFENLPEEIHNNRVTGNLNTTLETYNIIVKNFSDSTILEDYMFKNHDWIFWEYIYRIRFSSLGKCLSLPKCTTCKDFELRPSQLLSKISHKQIMNKKIQNLANGLSIENKLLLADVCNRRINEKDRKQILSQDENNYISTYNKYFS